jgi:hypothetical protein
MWPPSDPYRAPLEESKKWGLYYITNLLCKIYFKVRNKLMGFGLTV